MNMKFFVFLAILVQATLACQTLGAKASDYPAEWWQPVPPDQAYSWEILPQAAKPGEVILSKRNELGILSNFAATPFELRGVKYASVEGFWQMMKYPENSRDERLKNKNIKWAFNREQVTQMTAFEAKKAGSLAEENMKELNIDWVSFEGKKMKYRENSKGDFYQLVLEAEKAKLNQNEKVRQILVKTGSLVLKPDHIQDPDSPPAWKYNQIWMELRSQL